MLRDGTTAKNRAARKAVRLKKGQAVERDNDRLAPRAPSNSLNVSSNFPSVQRTIVLNPPTPDQEEYLRSIEQSSDNYDPDIVIGGPRQIRG